MNKPKIAQIAAISAIALVTLVSAGCAEPEAAAEDLNAISVSGDDFSANHDISEEIEVTTGSSVTIALCSNPATGFQWGQAQIVDQTVVTEIDRKFVEPGQTANGDILVGAPGQDIWTFKALKQGSTVISMDYGQPWEGGEKAEWTFNLSVTVK